MVIDIQFFTAILFRLINFGIIAIVAYYLYQRYIKADIKKGIQEKNAHAFALNDELKHLKQRHQTDEEKLATQEKECQDLQSHVLHWRKQFTAHQDSTQYEQEQLHQAMRKRVQKQQDVLAIHRIRSAILPQALERTKKELHIQYQQTQSGAQMVTKLIDSMIRETQV